MCFFQRREQQVSYAHSIIANNDNSILPSEDKTGSFISGPRTTTIAAVTDGTIFRQEMSENDVNDNFYSRNSNFKSNLHGHVGRNQISATVRQEAELNEKIEQIIMSLSEYDDERPFVEDHADGSLVKNMNNT